MPEPMLIEEFHLQLHIVGKLSPSQEEAILRTIRSATFARRLLSAARAAKRAFHSLRPVRMTLSQ